MGFKLQVLIEPEDGTYCGGCRLLDEFGPRASDPPWCPIYEVLCRDPKGGALRHKSCIAAEKAAKDAAYVEAKVVCPDDDE